MGGGEGEGDSDMGLGPRGIADALDLGAAVFFTFFFLGLSPLASEATARGAGGGAEGVKEAGPGARGFLAEAEEGGGIPFELDEGGASSTGLGTNVFKPVLATGWMSPGATGVKVAVVRGPWRGAATGTLGA